MDEKKKDLEGIEKLVSHLYCASSACTLWSLQVNFHM